MSSPLLHGGFMTPGESDVVVTTGRGTRDRCPHHTIGFSSCSCPSCLVNPLWFQAERLHHDEQDYGGTK